MTIPSSLQRAASVLWPITIMVLMPLIVAESINLWRKNRREKEVQFSNSKA